MGNVLTYCDYTGSSLRGSALSALNAARQLAQHHGGQVVALLVGADAAAAAGAAKKYAPKTVVVEDAGLANYMAETYAPIVARVAKDLGCTAVIAPANNTGKDFLPRVAAILDAGMASDISQVVAGNKFVRPILAGNALATVEITTPVVVVTARQSEFGAAEPLPAEGEVQNVAAGELNALGAEFVGLQVSKSERPELTDAKVIVAGGRGLKSAENFKALEQLADLFGAAIGASRAATDAGFVPPDLQIGQTGKVVAPELYFAVGISGAIQHLAGMKGSRVIVAINKDAEAPIFQVADYGLVSTWEKTLPELIEGVKKAQAESK